MRKVPFPGKTPYPRELTLWEPAGKAKAAVHIAHGMAEHIARYGRFATALTAAGYIVCGYNHLGHGVEAPLTGFFAQEDGWGQTVADIKTVMDWLKAEYPGVKRALLGHSMGSFLAREYAMRYPQGMDMLVLSGTANQPKALIAAGLLPAKILCAAGGARKRSKLLDKLAFSANNKPYAAEGGTGLNWLSRDKAEVQKYADDPLCGFVFTAGGFRDLFTGLLALTLTARLSALPDDLPVYLFSGNADPVGAMGRGVEEVAAQYRGAGLKDVSMKLYDGGRHEMLNETNRDEVTEDVIAWLDSHTG